VTSPPAEATFGEAAGNARRRPVRPFGGRESGAEIREIVPAGGSKRSGSLAKAEVVKVRFVQMETSPPCLFGCK
jgi:hypothetical protein